MHATLSDARSQEAAYLGGVRANLERHGAALAAEAVGLQRAAVAVSAGDGYRLVRDRALRAGLDPDAAAPLPANGELWAMLTRGRRAALHVFVKSFAGSQWLREAGCGLPGSADEEVAAYIATALRRIGAVPCLFALFAPGGWPASVRQRAHAGDDVQVLLSRVAPEADGDLWCGLSGGDYGWQAWLCLTPMSLERRTTWCAGRLDADPTLRRDGVLALGDAVARLGLPPSVGGRLVEATCSDASWSYRAGRTSSGARFIERKVR